MTGLRTRIVDAAAQLTVRSGWSAVTMARVADLAGVSRQTVYNEIGSKTDLAQALVLHELGRFLGVVEAAFDAHGNDLPEAIRAAVTGVLELAEDDALLRAVVSASQGGDTELLPLLTTRAGSLLATATAVLARRIEPLTPSVPADQRNAALDVIVRVVLSHVVQPGSEPPPTAAQAVSWAAALLLGLHPVASGSAGPGAPPPSPQKCCGS